jgi:transcriptional regulator with XRE-family HTH domain
MGLTQSELAECLCVTDQTVANYEKGKSGLGPADPLMRTYHLLSILPRKIRLEVIKSMMPPTGKAREKLPDVPRLQLVEHWVENEPQAA